MGLCLFYSISHTVFWLETLIHWHLKYVLTAAEAKSDSVRPHRWQPTRLHHPWDSPGKNTGVDCHFLLQCRKVKSESEVTQLSPTLHDPMDCSPPGSSVHGIFQTRALEWVALPSPCTYCHFVICFCSSPVFFLLLVSPLIVWGFSLAMFSFAFVYLLQVFDLWLWGWHMLTKRLCLLVLS